MQKNVRQRKVANPLVAGIESFVLEQSSWSLQDDSAGDVESNGMNSTSLLLEQVNLAVCHKSIRSSELPKRYTIYEPMLLLGPTFLTHTPTWQSFYQDLTPDQLQDLFQSVLQSFRKSGQQLTHIAANAPIQSALKMDDFGHEANIMRSPLNLQPLFGDFGPATSTSGKQLTSAELDATLWVGTSQVDGIKQVWAPRWTMFSRGNIREKSRILGQQGVFPGLTSAELGQPLSTIDVVDFYVGIGYFAFSFLKRGVRTVFGWDINPWSIEGLRRGCKKNGWKCLAVAVEDEANERTSTAQQIVQNLLSPSPPRCIAFCGDNRFAVEIMSCISAGLQKTERSLNIRHTNLGLLPTSQGAWQDSVRVVDEKNGGWLHVHENAEIALVISKQQEVLRGLRGALLSERREWTVSCENVEMVKTYAPGVGHYVFDVKLWPAP